MEISIRETVSPPGAGVVPQEIRLPYGKGGQTMNKKNNAGFSLVEIVVTVAILGILYTTVCTSLVWATKTNNRTTELLQAQLAVSSAVETLMAEGIQLSTEPTSDDPIEKYDWEEVEGEDVDRFPAATVTLIPQFDDAGNLLPYYQVTVTSSAEETKSVSITTYIRENVGGDT